MNEFEERKKSLPGSYLHDKFGPNGETNIFKGDHKD